MKIPVVSSVIKKFYGAPSVFAGGLVLNILGYHVIRVLFFNLIYTLRMKKTPEDKISRDIIKQVRENGIAVIPSFFSADIFQNIKDECDKIEIKVTNESAPHIKRETLAKDNYKNPNPILNKYLARNPFINQIVSGVLGKEILITPKVQLEYSFYREEDLGKPTTDVRPDNLHFDVSYPTVKCFLYLSDIDERNAAFRYIKGSHKMTLQRLRMEYKMSIAWFRGYHNNESSEVSQEFVEKQGMNLSTISGVANTLVIVNTMGFHSRGQYLTTTPRYILLVSYRELESLKYLKRKLFGRS